jgi:hypothetical protein
MRPATPFCGTVDDDDWGSLDSSSIRSNGLQGEEGVFMLLDMDLWDFGGENVYQ